MKFRPSAVAAILVLLIDSSWAFCPSHLQTLQPQKPRLKARSTTVIIKSTGVEEASAPSSPSSGTADAATELENLTRDIVSKLRFREVLRELERREMDTSGTFTDMRQRLLHAAAAAGDVADRSSEKNDGSDDVRVIDQEFLNAVSRQNSSSTGPFVALLCLLLISRFFSVSLVAFSGVQSQGHHLRRRVGS